MQTMAFCAMFVENNFMNGKPKKKTTEGANQGMSCSKDGCGAVKTNSSVGTNRQNAAGAKGLSSRPQYGSKVVTPRQAEKRAQKMAKIRSSAPSGKSNRDKF